MCHTSNSRGFFNHLIEVSKMLSTNISKIFVIRLFMHLILANSEITHFNLILMLNSQRTFSHSFQIY